MLDPLGPLTGGLGPRQLIELEAGPQSHSRQLDHPGCFSGRALTGFSPNSGQALVLSSSLVPGLQVLSYRQKDLHLPVAAPAYSLFLAPHHPQDEGASTHTTPLCCLGTLHFCIFLCAASLPPPWRPSENTRTFLWKAFLTATLSPLLQWFPNRNDVAPPQRTSGNVRRHFWLSHWWGTTGI